MGWKWAAPCYVVLAISMHDPEKTMAHAWPKNCVVLEPSVSLFDISTDIGEKYMQIKWLSREHRQSGIQVGSSLLMGWKWAVL